MPPVNKITRRALCILLLLLAATAIQAAEKKDRVDLDCPSVNISNATALTSVNAITSVAASMEVKGAPGKRFIALLNDNTAGRQFALAADGSLKRVEVDSDPAFELFSMARVGSEYVGISRMSSMRRYDRSLRYKGDVEEVDSLSRQKSAYPGLGIVGIYGHTMVGDLLVGYGYLAESETTAYYGFFRVSIAEGAGGTAELVMPFDRPEFYLMNRSMMTTLGGSVYAVIAGDYAELLRYDVHSGQQSVLAGFPAANDSLPVVKNVMSLGRSEGLDFVKSLDAPVALHGQSGFLYYLRREQPSGSFVLYKLRPGKHNVSVVETYNVKTDAPHLDLLTTPTSLIFIEKSDLHESALHGRGVQTISTMRVCPLQ